MVEITEQDARNGGLRALQRSGVPAQTAQVVMSNLINAERYGYKSHGLMRLPEYINDIQHERLDANAVPDVKQLGDSVYRVDGKMAFGQLAANAVANQLNDPTIERTIVVSLTNSGHIGRLADIVATAAATRLVMGCCNYLGHGQRVASSTSGPGRLCTNPLVLAIPCEGYPPIILDMTTSVVSEGKVREHWLAGQAVPDGWLNRFDGECCNDPAEIYSAPPTAAMAPLGAEVAYKGFGLALFVELLAGVLTGAGFCGSPASGGGNGGLFVSVPLNLLGRQVDSVVADVRKLTDHLMSAGPGVRIPGWRKPQSTDFFDIPIEAYAVLTCE